MRITIEEEEKNTNIVPGTTVLITDKNDANCGKSFPGYIAYYDVFFRGGSSLPIEDLYIVCIDGVDHRYLTSQVDANNYDEQLRQKEIERLGAKVGDKVRVLDSTNGGNFTYEFAMREAIKGTHTITHIYSSGHVQFDMGEACIFRPKVELIN